MSGGLEGEWGPRTGLTVARVKLGFSFSTKSQAARSCGIFVIASFWLILIVTYGESFTGAIAVGWSVVCFGLGHGVPVRLWLLVRVWDLGW